MESTDQVVEQQLLSLWDRPEKSSKKHERREKLLKFLSAETSQDIGVLLLYGKQLEREGAEEADQSAKIDNDDVERLVSQLFQKLGGSKEERVKTIKLLKLIIREGNRQFLWSIPEPAVPMIIPEVKGRFTPQRFDVSTRQREKGWREVFFRMLESQGQLDADGRLGLLLYSAICDGGLLATSLLNAFIRHPAELMSLNGQGYLHLRPVWSGHEGAESRMWFPSPLTQALVAKTIASGEWFSPPGNKKKHTSYVFRLISKFFKQAGLERSHRPRNISELLNATSLIYDLKLEPFVADFLKHRYLNHSLKPSALIRLSQDSPAKIHTLLGLDRTNIGVDSLEESEDLPTVEQQSSEEGYVIPGFQAEWSKSQKHDYLKYTLSQIKEACGDHEAHLYRLLAEWIDSELHGKAALSANSARYYFNTLSRNLFPAIQGQSLAELSALDFEELYQEAQFQLNSDGMQRKVAKMLMRFHRFLVSKYGLPDIDYREVLGTHDAPVPVDADLIYFDEYQKILKGLESSGLEKIYPGLVKVARLLVIVAFKCGLRRNEVLRARLADFQLYGSEPELLVRAHPGRRLKTPNAQRRIPLHALLSEDEIAELTAWYRKRLSDKGEVGRLEQGEETDNSDWASSRSSKPLDGYMFSIPEVNQHVVSQDLIMPYIHQVMRRVTGDESIRFHHFRHSFATWTLLRLLNLDYSKAPLDKLFVQRRETQRWIERSQRDVLMLLTEQHTRKKLFLLARLLGHSYPTISLEHYVHCLDWISAQRVRAITASDFHLVVKAAGLPQASAYRNGDGDVDRLLNYQLRKLKLLNLEVPSLPETNGDTLEVFDEVTEKLELCWRYLYVISRFNLDPKQMAQTYEIQPELAAQWVAAAQKLCNQQEVGRFRFAKHPEQTDKLLWAPAKPTESSEMALAWDWVKKLMRLDRDYRLEVLDIYQCYGWGKRYHLVFNSGEELKQLYSLMDVLGLTRDDIVCTLLMGELVTTREEAANRRYWKKALKPGWKRDVKTYKFSRMKNMGTHGLLAVNIQNKERNRASEAFRFVMAMAHILTD